MNFKVIAGHARDAILAARLPGANKELQVHMNDPDYDVKVRRRTLYTDTPSPDGCARLEIDLPVAKIRCTLAPRFDPHTLWVDGHFEEIKPEDVSRVEVMIPPGAARKPSQEGPLPGYRWLTLDEAFAALELYCAMEDGVRFEGIACTIDPGWPNWTFIELPNPGHPEELIVVAMPLVAGAWGPAVLSSFLFTVKKDLDHDELHAAARIRQHHEVPS